MEEVRLDVRQANELRRLVDFEQERCAADPLMKQCAFPFRAHDALQSELLAAGMLSMHTNKESQRSFVVISDKGYRYIGDLEQREQEARRWERRDWLIVLLSGLFGILGTIIGVLIGLTM